MKKAAFFLILFLIFASVVWGQAAEFTWTGATDDIWEKPGNWEENGTLATSFPGDGRNNDIVIINGFTGTINISSAITIQDLEIDSVSDVTIETIDDFEVSGTLTNDGTLNFHGVKLYANTLTNGGTLEFIGTDLSVVGVLTNTDTLNFDGDKLSADTLTNGGTLEFNGTELSVTDTLTNTDTLNFSGDKLSAGVLDNDGTFNFDGDELSVVGALTNTNTFNFDGTELSAGTLTNDGTLDLGGAGLTVGALTNNDIIKLKGSQAVSIGNASPPSGRIGGTIQYQGGTPLTPSSWSFGNLYTNLTIDSSATMDDAGVLNISDDAIFDSEIKAASLTVGDACTINANITTDENQSYTGTVTLGGTRTLTSTGGDITANGIVSGSNVTVDALHGISLANSANALNGNITLNNTQTGTASGNIIFTNFSMLNSLTAKNNSTNGNITINQTGNLSISSLQTGANGSVSIEASGAVTQTGAIETSSLTVETGTGITLLTQTNAVTTSVDLKSTAGDIKFVNRHGSAGNLAVTVNAPGDITITEELGGLEVEQITLGANIALKANTDIKTEGITVSGFITMEAGGDITVTDTISFNTPINTTNKVTLEADGDITVTDVTAYQLIAKATGVVTVNTVDIDSSNTGREKENAAIYIEAENFVVKSTIQGSIIPGGMPIGEQWGQLCLNLNVKWEDPDEIVDGKEGNSENLDLVPDARWHQYFIVLSGKNLVYGDGATPSDYYDDPSKYIVVKNNNNKTIFELDDGYSVYIYNADTTFENTAGLEFKTSGLGTIQFLGTNKFTKLKLEAETDITLEHIDTLSDITVETGTSKININQDITTTGTQEYKGKVTLGDNITLASTSTAGLVTLGAIAGDGKSLTIDGNGVLNGGTDIEDLSVTRDFSLVSGTLSAATVNVTKKSNIAGNIITTGDQTYTEEVTLGADITLASNSTAGLVTLGIITGDGNSLTITGNGVLNGGTDINILSVSGTTAIKADITTTETQFYKEDVTFSGTGTITLTGTTVTLGQFTGPGTGLSLTIDGNGVLNGGTDIEDLSVTGDFNLVSGTLSATKIDVIGTSSIYGNITTTGTQTYSGAVTLGGSQDTLTLRGTTVTLGEINGRGKSLTITGNGVLNGVLKDVLDGRGSIRVLSVSGTVTINADITTTENQTYTSAVTLGGTGKRIITSDNGNIVFSGTLNSTNAIELLATSGNITITGQVTANEIELLATSGNITINGKVTAKQLIAKASTVKGFYVSVNAVSIDSSNTGNELENAAIYIFADNFIVTTTTPSSIVPGGTGGQLCLHLNKKWLDTNGVVDGPEDTVPLGTVAGARWHQHFMVLGKILYSFTEDIDGNGKLDRIRVQTNKELEGDFSNFEVSVTGYEVEGYAIVNSTSGHTDNDSFYIYLKEKAEFDGDQTPQWSIKNNTSLKDATEIPMLDMTDMEYIDTIPPRIVYTLTLPEHPQTYVQISEPVKPSSGGNIAVGNVSFDGRTVTGVTKIDLGYLFDYLTSYNAEDLAQLTDIDSAPSVGYFQMNNIVDQGTEPNKIDASYPPKYPLDWTYAEYADSSVLIPPNKIIGVMQNPGSDTARRVTDVLVSVSPNNYFALPVWAKPSSDNISIMEFDGSKYLEKDPIEKSGIELQARISNNLTITPQLFWTMTDIPANMRNPKEVSDAKKVGGLWLPNALNPLYYYVPLSDGINPTPPAANSSSPLFNYDIAADKLANSGTKFEFIFRSSSASDMFIARLDAPPNTIPDKWYTLIRPFSFNIQGIRYQRGGVTILNNVINSDNKETAIIRYDLPRAGRVTVQIYTLDGTLVKSIRRNENREAGAYVDTWDGSNNGGRAVARGMYFVRVVGPDIDEIRKIMVVK